MQVGPDEASIPYDQCEHATRRDKNGNLIPPIYARHSLAYDSGRQKTVLHGRVTECTTRSGAFPPGETWEYDGERWSQVETEHSPPPAAQPELVYDPNRERIILLDTFLLTEMVIWEYDGNDWQSQPTENMPRTLETGVFPATYIPDSQAIFLLGTCRDHCEEGFYAGWLFNGREWIEQASTPYSITPTSAFKFMTPQIAYNESEGILVLQTGFIGQTHGSWTFEYNGKQWNAIFDDTSLSETNSLLLYFDMVFDSEREIVVLFGAFSRHEQLVTETWEYRDSIWREVMSIESPQAQIHHAMAYDQHRNVVVLYGGAEADSTSRFYETWEYDGVAWMQK